MANLFCVKDKVVIITGGAGILGRGIAGHLAEEGAKIVILDRAAEVGEQIVADIKAKGGEASFFLTDVLNKEILEQNKQERHIRGGLATKRKYALRKQQEEEEISHK